MAGEAVTRRGLAAALRERSAVLADLLRHPTACLGGILLAAYVFAAVFAPLLAPHDPERADLARRLLPPVWEAGGVRPHLLGTDQLGRDLLSRMIFGARVSLLVGLITVVISHLVGVGLGCLAGYYRGPADAVLSRLADLLLAFPYLIFAIGAMGMMGPGFWNLVWALAFKGWVEFYRLARGDTMAEKEKAYIEAAHALGRRDLAIVAREILPNILPTTLVLGTLRVGYMIVLEASLSFLGLGIPPRIPAWGSMVNDGRGVMLTAWWVSTLPGLALVGAVLAMNLLGEGLREALDPRLRGPRAAPLPTS
jgi:peptide/nickel transport system permease protein